MVLFAEAGQLLQRGDDESDGSLLGPGVSHFFLVQSEGLHRGIREGREAGTEGREEGRKAGIKGGRQGQKAGTEGRDRRQGRKAGKQV